jgi:hypothetical protein
MFSALRKTINMKITTWNLQRLEKNKNGEICNKLLELLSGGVFARVNYKLLRNFAAKPRRKMKL